MSLLILAPLLLSLDSRCESLIEDGERATVGLVTTTVDDETADTAGDGDDDDAVIPDSQLNDLLRPRCLLVAVASS